MNNFNTILVYFLSLTFKIHALNKDCRLLKTKYIDKTISNIKALNNTIVYKNFNKIEDLYLNCFMNISVTTALYIPNDYVLLDNVIDYKNLTSTINLYDKNQLFFYNIKGFNFKLTMSKYNMNKIYHAISNAYFDFYLYGNKIDRNLCDLSNFKKDTSFFGSINNLNLIRNVKYSTETCPFGFINSKLFNLFIGEISNSLIYKNRLEFIDINQIDTFDLNNKNFYVLHLKCAYENITLKLIDKYVFKYMNTLIIYGIITDMQLDLFKHFKYLRLLQLNIENLVRTLSNNNKWISYLNNEINVNLYDKKQLNLLFSFTFLLDINEIDEFTNTPYRYPNEDFCLFQYYPHDHLVFPVIASTIELGCSCTLLWLIRYYDVYLTSDFKYIKGFNIHYLKENSSLKKCFNKSIIRACNLDDRIQKCNRSNFRSDSVSKFSLNNRIDIMYLIKWCELIVFMFLQPLFCLFSIITNILTIVVLKNKNSIENMKDNMYKHIYINSIFNITYSILSILKLINICVFELSPFCSSIYQNKASQYYKLYGLFFVGNSIKLCCNVSYISFSVSRLLMSTNKHSKVYKKIENLNVKLYYLIVFTLSILFSLFKIFEYQINEIYLSNKSFPFKKYDVGNCDKGDFYCTLFRVFNLIYDLVKDVLFFFINLVIDLFLFVKSKKHVEHKKKILSDIIKIDIAIKFKNKMNRMIFLNGVLFIIAYFPEFITNIILIVYDKKINLFCYQFISCNELNEFAQFFNFISIGMQFFVLKKFNKTFKRNYNEIKNNMLDRFKLKSNKK